MPELPEAETIRRQLASSVVGARIKQVKVNLHRSIRRHSSSLQFSRLVKGKQITSVERRGKAIVITLDDTHTLVVRLGMSGNILLRPKGHPRDKHGHVIFRLDDGRQLRFVDARQFGEVYAEAETDWGKIPDLAKYGPEPLCRELTPEYLHSKLAKRSGKIKPILMDQGFIAGIGNIYADEICFQTGIHPERPANSLSSAECTKLHQTIREILPEAIKHAGTSWQDQAYVDLFGELGSFQNLLNVYQREGERCPRCGTPIRRTRISNRSAHFCPKCQPRRCKRA